MENFVEGTVVPKSFLPAIGFVIVAFSRLDVDIDIAIAHLLGFRDSATGNARPVRRAIAEAAWPYRPRIVLLKQLVEIMLADDPRAPGKDKEKTTTRRRLLTVVKAIETVSDDRHRLIHDEFNSFSHMREEANMVRKGPAAEKGRTFTKVKLKELGSKISDLSYRLRRYQQGDPNWAEGERFPWRDRPLPRPQPGSPRL